MDGHFDNYYNTIGKTCKKPCETRRTRTRKNRPAKWASAAPDAETAAFLCGNRLFIVLQQCLLQCIFAFQVPSVICKLFVSMWDLKLQNAIFLMVKHISKLWLHRNFFHRESWLFFFITHSMALGGVGLSWVIFQKLTACNFSVDDHQSSPTLLVC